ncbi:hypothetical protein QQP08_016838 [Theobroma cacao]|nr:hypothetical protein QQP08_016838 [Theobroma cacao]
MLLTFPSYPTPAVTNFRYKTSVGIERHKHKIPGIIFESFNYKGVFLFLSLVKLLNACAVT